MRFLLIALAVLLFAAACSGGDGDTTPVASPSPAAEESPQPSPSREDAGPTPSPAPSPDESEPEPSLIDPRGDGLDVVMGEWAVTLEADAIRLGPVTFVIHNRGTKEHGFRIRDDSSGSGGDRFEQRTALIAPAATAELTVELTGGTYEVDCYVEEPGVGEHDELGMETTLSVTDNAPLIEAPQPPSEASSQVAVQGFAFQPEVLEVAAGTTVDWTNNDPTAHTVTATEGAFDSGNLDSGATFTREFDTAGTFTYRCAIHPQMRGRIEVTS